MNLRVIISAILISAFGIFIIAYKVSVLGYEIIPRTTKDRWSVQMLLKYRGVGDNAETRIFLPSDRPPHQMIHDERIVSEGADFDIRTHGGNRIGVLSGRVGGISKLSYRFTAHLDTSYGPLPPDEEIRDYEPDPESEWLAPERYIQSDDPKIAERLMEINHPDAGPSDTVRHIAEYVADEIVDPDPGEDNDALSVLKVERGGSLGKVRLTVAMARAAGIPARVVGGCDPASYNRNEILYWAEVKLGGRWYSIDPASGYTGKPLKRIILFEGDMLPYTSTATEDLSFHITALREELSQHRLYSRRASESDNILDRFSLYTLPVRTQMTLRILLLIPFGALIVSVFRNMIGVPTFGTFMPVLLALAFIETTLIFGTVLLLLIIGLGWIFRSILDWMQLLMVPRLSFLLTVVIGIIMLISLVSDSMNITAGLYASAFPIVIITATIERFSVMIVEEGPRNALKTTLGTIVVALACYAVLMSEILQRIVLAFPELLFVVLGILLLIGRYTGYRLSEWLRFSAFKRGFSGT